MTLAEMHGRMSSREFAAWIAFDTIQPIGNRRLDLLFAQLSALVKAAVTGRREAFGQFDIFGHSASSGGHAPRRSIEQQKAAAMRLTRTLGGKVS